MLAAVQPARLSFRSSLMIISSTRVPSANAKGVVGRSKPASKTAVIEVVMVIPPSADSIRLPQVKNPPRKPRNTRKKPRRNPEFLRVLRVFRGLNLPLFFK